MNIETELVKKYRSIAEKILKNEISLKLVYHTIDHTRSVVTAFLEIGQASNLSEKELELGSIAAWFHDTGYSVQRQNHEEESVKIFDEHAVKEDFTAAETEIIHKLILSTKMPQNPETTMEKVLCDADLHHLGTALYFELSDLLKEEYENDLERKIKKDKWHLESYYFLMTHNYFTSYAIEKYGKKKEENQFELRGKIKEFTKQDKQIKSLESKLAKLNAKLIQKPSRGIETMFRITSRNHLQLSSMADSKANIMISINTIVISVVITASAGRLAEYPGLLYPVISLILVCLATIVLSILATRPSVSEGKFSRDDIINKRTNLLFFGNFHGMDIEDYEWGVTEMMKDADYLYSSLTRDVFFLGKVLGKKYKILRAAYTTFMIGFVVSILLFVFFAIRNQSIQL